MKRILALFSWIGMQAPVYAQRMMEMGAPAERVAVGGNLKCDQDLVTMTDVERSDLIRSLGWDPESTRILVAGSTHEGEEETVFKTFAKLTENEPALRLIIAPRNPQRAEKICALGRGHGTCLRQTVSKGRTGRPPSCNSGLHGGIIPSLRPGGSGLCGRKHGERGRAQSAGACGAQKARFFSGRTWKTFPM